MGFGDIMDEKGKLIGKMNRIIFSIRRRVELQEVDGTVVATIQSKILSARGAQDLKDPAGNMIARIKRKILTFFKHKFFLESPDGTRWYEAIGNFMGWSFKVYEVATNKLIAEIENGILVTDFMMGMLHSNLISGDFSVVSPSSFVIENGEIKRPLDAVTIAGNLYSAFNQIIAFGNDNKLTFMGKVPSLAFDGFTVSG